MGKEHRWKYEDQDRFNAHGYWIHFLWFWNQKVEYEKEVKEGSDPEDGIFQFSGLAVVPDDIGENRKFRSGKESLLGFSEAFGQIVIEMKEKENDDAINADDERLRIFAGFPKKKNYWKQQIGGFQKIWKKLFYNFGFLQK